MDGKQIVDFREWTALYHISQAIPAANVMMVSGVPTLK